MNRDFPQFHDLLVAVIDADEPGGGGRHSRRAGRALRPTTRISTSVRRPDAVPFLRKEGLLFLDTKQLSDLMDRTIDAQPFLGQLAADPTARGLFSALSLLGMGVTQGRCGSRPLSGIARRLSIAPWPKRWAAIRSRCHGSDCWAATLSDLAGKYRFVLAQPKLDFGALQPGGDATEAMRAVIADLEFVKSGDARVRITGQVALADEEFATVAQGAVTGLIGSLLLITLWLFLAVRTWRLILPILLRWGSGSC